MSVGEVTLMLCGDVMLGRGIDQVLPHPSPPVLYEQYVRSALDYVALAEQAHGSIPRNVAPSYVWGDALDELMLRQPDLRIINLETAVTRADQPAPKGINYRMNPANLPGLTAAGIDCCVLANNHVLDWGRKGLIETLQSLQSAGITTAGAGHDLDEAAAPAIFQVPGKGCVLVYAAAHGSSGVPSDWAAGRRQPGVNLIGDLSDESARRVTERIACDRHPGDVVVFSIHWGSNWGYGIRHEERAFAHRLIDSGQVNVVHGHSSHHFKAVEAYGGGLILYGCGDFLNDYEGIGGYETYRSDLALMYLVTTAVARRQPSALTMLPFRIRNFRLNRVGHDDAEWMRRKMDQECRRYGAEIVLGGSDKAHSLVLVSEKRPRRQAD
jgi:poly-gamma-glutamate capsule biosynthesis protein CapA/YwtB (metallophosphatase superfamily)